MPLSRSNTLRNKSRSPAPSPANVQGELMHNQRTGGTQRPFLPPSHYAAAGGYLTPEHALSAKHYAFGDMDLGEPHRGFGGENITFTPPLKYSRNDIDPRNELQSRLPRDATPRKAHHTGPMEGGSDVNPGLNKFSTHSHEPVEHSEGFSNVEYQMAPSLRNTVDRITGSPHFQIGAGNLSYLERKPSKVSIAPTSNAFHDELSCASPQHTSNYAPYSVKQAKSTSERVNSPLTRNKFSHLPDATSPGLDRTHHREAKGMQKIRHDVTSTNLPTRREELEGFVPPGPAVRLPAKPALKHRGTSSMESQNKSEVPSQHNHHTQASHSMNPLRTVRSLLSRKNSNTMRSSAAAPKTTQIASSQGDIAANTQETSRYGTVNSMKVKRYPPESIYTGTPQRDQDFGVEARSSSRSSTSKSPFKSNIPRRTYRMKTHKYGDSSEDLASVSFDDSDLEVRCELERTGSRRLMVANGRAEVSESGSILDSSSTSTATFGPDIGLGFDAPFPYSHIVEGEAEPNESTSLDEEILRHLDPPLYASSVRRNDSGVGLGVSVSPVPYHQVSPQPQHQQNEDRVANMKKSFTQNRSPTLPMQHTQNGLTYGSFVPPGVASKPSFSPSRTPITSQEKTLRFSLPPSDSGISTYSDEEVLVPDIEQNRSQTVRTCREERRALLDWNGRLSQHPSKSVTATGIGSQKSTPKHDHGVTLDGYSNRTSPISRFSSPKNQQPPATKYDSCDSEDAGYIEPRRKGSQRGKTARPRSVSVGPRRRSLATEGEEEQFIHIPAKSTTHARLDRQPPRPTSACQLSRKKNPSTERNGRERRPASQVFPAHLRDLIRDRTTSTHSDINADDHYHGQPNVYDEGYDSVSASEIASPVVSPATAHQTGIHADRYRDIPPSTNHTPASTPRPKFHPPQPDLSGKDLRSIAARERLALGIPPSDSDEVVHSPSKIQYHDGVRDGEEGSSGGLSHAESDMSSLNQSLWQAEEEQRREDDGHKLLQSISWRVEGRRSKAKFHQPDSRDSLTTPRLSIISPTESGSSSCEGLHEQTQSATRPSPQSLENRIRPHEPQATSDYALNPKLGPHTHIPSQNTDVQPQTREAVIQELFESEEALLRLLHICVNNFILPLRVQNSSAWISGVPSSISKLLDWFDDIVRLHEGIHAGLSAARDMQTAESERVSEVLRECFILRVEVYMPYFMRINDVLDEVAALVGRQCVNEEGLVANNAGVGARKSEFGQFILLQERTAECQGWTLDGLLRLPLRRLEVYQSLFAKMLQLTPKSHQDYLSTLSLSRSTDVAMQVMMEVKFREDEYQLLRSFAKRIQASYSLDHLPTRERRLLFSGPCLLLRPGYLLSSAALSPGTPHDETPGNYVTEAGIQRSDSIRSAGSMPAQDGRRNPSSKSSWFSLLPRRKRNKTKCSAVSVGDSVTASGSLSDPEEISSLEGTPLYAFVFNDLILLAHAHAHDNNAENAPWHLFEDSGIVKPISTSHLQHPKVQAGFLVSMDVVVLDIENINDSAEDFSRYSHRQLDLVFTPPPPGSTDQENLTLDSLRSDLAACRSTVLKWLSIPKYRNAPGGSTSAVTDHALDTQEIISSLIASGLPLPRSPSGQILDGRHCGAYSQADNDGDEREERGWWSLCYQRSMRELQRKDWQSFTGVC